MPNYSTIRCNSSLELADSAANNCLDLLTSNPRQKALHLVLCGGRSARGFFRALVEHQADVEPDWTRFHFYWADERCVPPDHDESNFRLAQETLFGPLQIALAQVHRIPGELPPEDAVREATASVLGLVPVNIEGVPVFDLVLLSMGEDGHIASLFPQMDLARMNHPGLYQAVTAVKPPPQRITMGLPALIAARQVWVLASGPGKREALNASLQPQGKTPLARLLQARSETLVFTDIA
jgi:6-phosphogluconolactonase